MSAAGGKWIAEERGAFAGDVEVPMVEFRQPARRWPLAQRISADDFSALMILRASLPSRFCAPLFEVFAAYGADNR